MKLGEIATTLGATLENGDPKTEITGVSGIEEAAAGQITFVANPKYFAAAKNTAATAIIVSEDFPVGSPAHCCAARILISVSRVPLTCSTNRHDMLPEFIPLQS